MLESPKKKFYKTNWFLWIMLFFVTPIGLALLWLRKDLEFSKKTKSILTAIFSLLFLIVGMNSESQKEYIETPVIVDVDKQTEESEKQPEPIELTFEEQVEKIAKEAAGNDDFVNLEWYDEDKKILMVNLKMGDGFSNNAIRRGMLLDAELILKKLSDNETFKNLTRIKIIHQGDFVDKFGNTTVLNAGMVSIDVSTVMKINWKNFLTMNLADIAETYYIHPSLKD